MPLPAALRALSVPLLLPLLWPVVAAPPAGRFDLLAVDVGQGTAVLVRTRHHLLVYDAGPRIGREGDAGERHLLPLLRARGERRIDQLLLSHRDADHVGGAGSLLRALPVAELRSSLEPGHPLAEQAAAAGARVVACEAGQAWTWDGVDFELLHPPPGTADAPLDRGPKSNDRSCVLRVAERPQARHGPPRSALLTGDIEAAAEAALLDRAAQLPADWVLVPHHGSRTSSSAAFVEAVAPRWAVVQAAYRSRFGHPSPQVLARYQAAGVEVLATPQCGAVHWRHDQERPVCERARVRRHWNHPDSVQTRR